jgi:hypothetical protein
MIVGEISDVGSLGRKGRRGRGFGPGWGYGPGWWGADYVPEVIPAADKFVLVNPEGKGTVVVTQIPGDLPAGWTFRRATTAEAALNKALSGFGQIPEIVSAVVKVGADIYAQKQAARAKKKAEQDTARQAAMEQARAQQQALIYSGGSSGGFPWMIVGIAGVSVVALGTIGYLLLRKK